MKFVTQSLKLKLAPDLAFRTYLDGKRQFEFGNAEQDTWTHFKNPMQHLYLQN